MEDWMEGGSLDDPAGEGVCQLQRLAAADKLANAAMWVVAQALAAYQRLAEHGVVSCVTAIVEPGRFRHERDVIERDFVESDSTVTSLFSSNLPRVLLSHTRAGSMLGCLRRIDGGPQKTVALGFINRGGTLYVFGMLFANHCPWGMQSPQLAGLRICQKSFCL